MTPEQFIGLWKDNRLNERAGAQQHFNDLCELLCVDKPRDPDHYCFERGAKKSGGGDGWADVWKRGCFGWENKKPGRDLTAALKQLTDYALQHENLPLLGRRSSSPPRATRPGRSPGLRLDRLHPGYG